jgi:hypothetical protein
MATATPFVKRMRTQGGTIYTFSSALEDIGLNINERNNVVKMSHYALLNIPSIDAPDNLQQNRFNVLAIPGAYQSFLNSGSIKDGRIIVAESFQNYALNLEVNLLRQGTYNAALSTTISERVFWKWLKETGAIRWQSYDTSIGLYWQEERDTDSSIGYNSVVKCIGQISAGSVRTDTFGTYNETYVLVPTSFGQTPVYFKQVEDDNYYHGLSILEGNTNIYGRETFLRPHPDALDFKAYYDLADSSTEVVGVDMYYDASDGSGYQTGWWWTAEGLYLDVDNNYYIDTSTYIDSGIYNFNLQYNSVLEYKRSNVDCISIEYDLDNLKTIFNDPALTFDRLAIDPAYVLDDTFDFNAIMIYYSVYNKTLDKVLATNLLGILFLDAPSGNTQDYPLNQIILPSITKIQSGPTGFGTSYSFRLNIKSDYMLDDTAATIMDESTSDQIVLEDFTDVFDSLGKTLAILNQHTGTINYITEQYLDITSQQTNILNSIIALEQLLNDINSISGTDNAIPMFSTQSILTESSIYMDDGRIGFFNKYPIYPAQFDVSVKVMDLIIENAVRDTGGNILLGYGSPLQIGCSTNYRDITFYTGGPRPVMTIDTSGHVIFDSSTSIVSSTIIIESSLGDSFYWDNGMLEASGTGGGTQGIQGIQGVTAGGTQGIQGRQGTQGTQGRQGTIGTGLQGNQGTAGSVQGTQGIQGITGAGTQGTQGTSGGGASLPANWSFVASGNNLVLKYIDVSLFMFTTDGSILSKGEITAFANIV